MKQLIEEIKKKKELSDIPDSLVEETVNKKLKGKIPENKRDRKEIIKIARAELRKYTGRFSISLKKREKLLEENKIKELLKSHTSTKERLDIYPEVIKMIKELNPESILDLGCGLNPIAISKSFPESEYLAYDIKEDELKLIEKFFKKEKINGKTFVKDIREIEKFPETDLCLIFKTLDIIETKGHKYAHKIIEKLKSKNTIVSFSTRTLSGKPMKNSRRFWFESILKSLGKDYEIKLFDNEIFYIF